MNRCIRHRPPIAGFTLLELLIAIAIFALVGMLAMGGFNQMTQHRDRAMETMARTRSIQRAVMRMSLDFTQLDARPIRDATSTTWNPALRSFNSGAYALELTHAGWTNPTGQPRPTLQRVGYRLVDGKLYRDYWPVLDRTLNTQPVQALLLEKISKVSFRYMDSNKLWQNDWPSQNAGGTGAMRARTLPLAVEITLTFDDWGEIKRVVEVAAG